jgi:hypothetical protein
MSSNWRMSKPTQDHWNSNTTGNCVRSLLPSTNQPEPSNKFHYFDANDFSLIYFLTLNYKFLKQFDGRNAHGCLVSRKFLVDLIQAMSSEKAIFIK